MDEINKQEFENSETLNSKKKDVDWQEKAVEEGSKEAMRILHGLSRVQSLSDEDLGKIALIQGRIDGKIVPIKKPSILLILLNNWRDLLGGLIGRDMYRATPWRSIGIGKNTAGRFIYRGENKDYGLVSSSLYRYCAEKCTDWEKYSSKKKESILNFLSGESELQTSWGGFKGFLDHTKQQECLASVMWQSFNPPGSAVLKDDASAVQHLGGKTNRIDFTDNLLVALFFACFEESRGGCNKEDGRLLFVHTDKLGFSNVERPRAEHVDPIQQSVLVKPKNGGVLNLGDFFCIMIPKELKENLLDELDLFFGINLETIFSGVVPYSRHQDVFLERSLLSAEEILKNEK